MEDLSKEPGSSDQADITRDRVRLLTFRQVAGDEAADEYIRIKQEQDAAAVEQRQASGHYGIRAIFGSPLR
jgi:hypothetical protein